jgi:predicted kinase
MITLLLLVGLPYSGKSTWARAHLSWPVVAPDQIRIALHGHRYEPRGEAFVWAIAKVMVRALFGAGHNTVIFDACNVSETRRQEWESPDWAIQYVVIDTPVQTCIDRALAVGDKDIIPVIERMALAWSLAGIPLDDPTTRIVR